jgi:hypothetical protein
MTGPAPPSEALIRLALAKVQPLPSHEPAVKQTVDPLQAMQKAQTIGPARVGERYQDDLNPSLVGIARKVLGGAQRPASVAAEDPYGIGAWLKGAGPMPTPIAAEIQAYHGSPHDFEKFLLEKIGTGEGAQAYGHGLYFAENPAVAEEYKRNLTDYAVKVGDKAYSAQDTLSDPVARAARALANHGGDVDLAKRELWDASLGSYTKDRADFLHQALKSVDDVVAKGGAQKLTGRMYEVSIKADPDQFLDWDKPLSQQPPKVQAKLKALGVEIGSVKYPTLKQARQLFQSPRVLADARADIGTRDVMNQGFRYVQADDEAGFRAWFDQHGGSLSPGRHQDVTGSEALQNLAVKNWDPAVGNMTAAQKAAAERLRDAGIPGVRYADQGSRGAVAQDRHTLSMVAPDGHTVSSFVFPTRAEAEAAVPSIQKQLKGMGPLTPQFEFIPAKPQTSNYVVFDDKLIDILKKYAVAGAVGGSLASLGQQQTEEQK